MFRFKKDNRVSSETIRVGRVPVLILRNRETSSKVPGVLWIHGGGYITGMKEMVYMGRGQDLTAKFGAVVLSPDYRLAFRAPFPAALEDCFETLQYMVKNAESLGINPHQIMIGGESAGGGLCAALCMLARDRGIRIAFQMPLYPMLDNLDTESSKDNHGKVWNTKRNHFAWRMYLRKSAKENVSAYASPAHAQDYSNLPPAYSFVGDGEPFYVETLQYIRNLKDAGVEATADVYPCNVHAFDIMQPDHEISKTAVAEFELQFQYAMEHYSTVKPANE